MGAMMPSGCSTGPSKVALHQCPARSAVVGSKRSSVPFRAGYKLPPGRTWPSDVFSYPRKVKELNKLDILCDMT